MRYRALSATGDYTFGRGVDNFLVDSPDTVRQSILTRLRLLRGEWFLDQNDGTPWMQQILGKGTNKTYDLAIQTRILQTTGVKSIVEYQSQVDPDTRKLSVAALVDTVYSTEPISVEVVI